MICSSRLRFYQYTAPQRRIKTNRMYTSPGISAICSNYLCQMSVSLLAKPVSCTHSIHDRAPKIKMFFCPFSIVFYPHATSLHQLETLTMRIFQRFRPIFVRAYNAWISSKFLCTISVSRPIWRYSSPILSDFLLNPPPHSLPENKRKQLLPHK